VSDDQNTLAHHQTHTQPSTSISTLTLPATRAMSVKPATARSAAFVEFLEAPDLPQLLSAFETGVLAGL
jgi:hypothetical protein